MDLLPQLGLLLIFLLVLVLPFRVRCIERNLELFLFACGIAALTIAGFAAIPGQATGWSPAVVAEALVSPVAVASLFGIPVGIVQIVLLAGLLVSFCYERIQRAVLGLAARLTPAGTVFAVIVVLGLAASLISAILAAVLLVEIVNVLSLGRETKIRIVIVACFSIGLGAGLTPLGEPLSTIVVAKLAGAPYHAGFSFLFDRLGLYVIGAILALGILGVFLLRRDTPGSGSLSCVVERETVKEVLLRAGKVYLFIMALVFLGEGFRPLILAYVTGIPAPALFGINIVSAVLDNATLAAAEIGPALSSGQITAALMGLLIAGGMLIPGNIPNIIASCKLGIGSSEWARTGLPLGAALMLAFFVILFLLPRPA